MKVENLRPNENQLCTRVDTSSLVPPRARALTGDRARERGAENRADAPIHLINVRRNSELENTRFYIVSPFIFSSQKKKKTGPGKIGEKKEKEKGGLLRDDHDIEREKDKYEEEKHERKRFQCCLWCRRRIRITDGLYEKKEEEEEEEK